MCIIYHTCYCLCPVISLTSLLKCECSQIFVLFCFRFKNVSFEISSTEDPAVFECTAKLLAVSETHSLKFQVQYNQPPQI